MELVHQINMNNTTNDLTIKKTHYDTCDFISCTKQILLISEYSFSLLFVSKKESPNFFSQAQDCPE